MTRRDTAPHATRHRLTRRQRARLIRVMIYAASFAAIAAVILAVDWSRVQRAFFQWDLVREQFPEIVTQAAKNTLVFSLFGFSGGMLLGLALALLRLSTIRAYRWFAASYIEVLRGLPLLLTLFILGFGLPIALDLRLERTFLGDIFGVYTTGSVALALVAGAYIAETIRAGIEAVPGGQMEAARSLGMTYPRAMATIVIPQAFRIIVPPLTNEFVLLLKDTSLISALGVTEATKELTRFGREGVAQTFNATPLMVAGLMYLVITIPLTRVAAQLERRSRAAR